MHKMNNKIVTKTAASAAGVPQYTPKQISADKYAIKNVLNNIKLVLNIKYFIKKKGSC